VKPNWVSLVLALGFLNPSILDNIGVEDFFSVRGRHSQDKDVNVLDRKPEQMVADRSARNNGLPSNRRTEKPGAGEFALGIEWLRFLSQPQGQRLSRSVR
jgi:hypothetical protein